MKLDLSKPVRTRDGRPARIICTDCRGSEYTLVALVTYNDGAERPRRFTASGAFHNECTSLGLVNVPEKRSMWVNIYPYGRVCVHETRASVDAGAELNSRLACVEITYEVPAS